MSQNNPKQVKPNSLNIQQADVKQDNQEVELRSLVIRTMRYANQLTPYKLDDPIDPLVNAAIDLTVEDFQAHTTKLLNEQLDRLESEANTYTTKLQGYETKGELIPLSAIEKERDRL